MESLRPAPAADHPRHACGRDRPGGDVTEIRYARSGDVHIAYTVMGQGLLDLIVVPSWASNIGFVRGGSARSPSEQAVGVFQPADRLRQAGYGTLRPAGRIADARGTYGRRAGGHGRGGLTTSGLVGVLGRRTDECAVRGHLSRSGDLPDPLRNDGRLHPDARAPLAPTPEANEAAYANVETAWGRGLAVDRLAPSLAGDDAFRR